MGIWDLSKCVSTPTPLLLNQPTMLACLLCFARSPIQREYRRRQQKKNDLDRADPTYQGSIYTSAPKCLDNENKCTTYSIWRHATGGDAP